MDNRSCSCPKRRFGLLGLVSAGQTPIGYQHHLYVHTHIFNRYFVDEFKYDYDDVDKLSVILITHPIPLLRSAVRFRYKETEQYVRTVSLHPLSNKKFFYLTMCEKEQ